MHAFEDSPGCEIFSAHGDKTSRPYTHTHTHRHTHTLHSNSRALTPTHTHTLLLLSRVSTELKDKVMGPYSRALPVVLEQANLKLQEVHTAHHHAVLVCCHTLQVFGLEVREVTKGKTKSIILINKLPPSLTSEFLKWCVCMNIVGGCILYWDILDTVTN